MNCSGFLGNSAADCSLARRRARQRGDASPTQELGANRRLVALQAWIIPIGRFRVEYLADSRCKILQAKWLLQTHGPRCLACRTRGP